MKIANLHRANEWFQVLQTTTHTQTAVMTLDVGGSSGQELEAHAGSEQTLLVVDGEVRGEILGEEVLLGPGHSVIVPAGVKHRFSNAGQKRALTFNVYAPPAYPS